MSDSPELTPHQPPRSIVPMFIGGLVLLLLFWFGAKALLQFGAQPDSYDLRRAEERRQIHAKVQAEAEQALNQYAWIDQKQGIVQLPVQRAMELTVEALALNNHVRPAGFIDPLRAMADQQPSPEPAPPEQAPATEGGSSPSEASPPSPEASAAPVDSPTTR